MNNLIPAPLMELASSKKAITFWVIVGLFLLQKQTGLDNYQMMWISISFCAYAIAQGFADFGRGMGGVDDGK